MARRGVKPWTREQRRGVNEVLKLEMALTRPRVSKRRNKVPKIPEQEKALFLRPDPAAGAARIQGQWQSLQHQLGHRPCELSTKPTPESHQQAWTAVSSCPAFTGPGLRRPKKPGFKSEPEVMAAERGTKCSNAGHWNAHLGDQKQWSRPQAQWASTHAPKWHFDDGGSTKWFHRHSKQQQDWDGSLAYAWQEDAEEPRGPSIDELMQPKQERLWIEFSKKHGNVAAHWSGGNHPWNLDECELVRWTAADAEAVEARIAQESLAEDLPEGFLASSCSQEQLEQQASSSSKKALPGVVPGKETLVYDALYETLKEEGGWTSTTPQKLEPFKQSIEHPHQVSLVLNKLGNAEAALGLFLWARLIPGFKHDPVNYSTMFRILGEAGNVTMAEQLFKEMGELCKGQVDTFAINSMMRCYLRVNRIQSALELYRQMQSLYQCKPDRWTFAQLIDWLGKFGSREQLHKVYMDLCRTPEQADARVFNSMIYNFGKLGDLLNAREAAKQMKRWNIPFSTGTYGVLIHMFARNQQFQAAHETYAEYIGSSKLPPDIVVFNNAVLSYGLAARLRDAELVIGHMEKAGLVPDKFTYCTIISAWAREGGIEQSKSWFDKAVARGLAPSSEMCNALLDGFLKAKQTKQAEQLMLEMNRLGAKPTLQTYTMLLQHYTTSRRLDSRVVRKMMQSTGLGADRYFTGIFDSKKKDAELVADSTGFFASIAQSSRPRWGLSFANALVHYLHSYGYTRQAYLVFQGVLSSRLYGRSIVEEMDQCWYIWLLDMEVGTALVAMTKGLMICKDKLEQSFGPDKVFVITGYIRPTSRMVTEAVDAALDALKSPFEQNIQLGRFMCEGNLFRQWILEPQVVRELGSS